MALVRRNAPCARAGCARRAVPSGRRPSRRAPRRDRRSGVTGHHGRRACLPACPRWGVCRAGRGSRSRRRDGCWRCWSRNRRVDAGAGRGRAGHRHQRAAFAALHHVARGGLEGEEHAVEIDAHKATPFLVIQFQQRAIAAARDAGGSVSADQRTLDNDRSVATLTLRVPSTAFTSTVEKVAKLGTEVSRSVQSQDVTESLVDVDARIATQRASVDRVRAPAILWKNSRPRASLRRRSPSLQSQNGQRTLGRRWRAPTPSGLTQEHVERNQRGPGGADGTRTRNFRRDRPVL